MIDNKGHIIHIDFGFMLGISPGGIDFECVPFKLTEEYVDLMGGLKSEMFIYFKILLLRGLTVLRKHTDTFINIIKIFQYRSGFTCFSQFDMNEFKSRFGIGLTDQEVFFLVVKNRGKIW